MTRGRLVLGLVVAAGACAVALACSADSGSGNNSTGTGGGTSVSCEADGVCQTVCATDPDCAGTGGAFGTGGGPAAGGPATGGHGGSSGMATVGETGALGDACSPPAALACAGNYQKVSLICDADGTWGINMTCPGEQICDTRPGVNAGTCQEQPPDCLGYGPGHLFCRDNAVYACGPDSLSTELVQACTGLCVDGVCNNDVDPCPDSPNVIDCALDCGGGSSSCDADVTCPRVLMGLAAQSVGDFRVVRLPSFDDACSCATARYLQIRIQLFEPYAVRVTVAEPWSVVESFPPCGSYTVQQCLVVGQGGGHETKVSLVTEDPTAQPRNVRLEAVLPREGCP